MRFFTAAVIAFIAYTNTQALAAPAPLVHLVSTTEVDTSTSALAPHHPQFPGIGVVAKRDFQEIEPRTEVIIGGFHRLFCYFHIRHDCDQGFLKVNKRDLQEIEARDPHHNHDHNQGGGDPNQTGDGVERRDLQEIKARHVPSWKKLLCAVGMHLQACELAPGHGPRHFVEDEGQ
jgi:hypothetical protein